MKTLRLFAGAVALGVGSLSLAADIQFTGSISMSSLTGNPWVTPSFMWGQIDSGSLTATSISGFTSLNGSDPSKLVFSFTSTMGLTSFQIPGAASAGFERYTPSGGGTSFQVTYDGTVLATGVAVFLRSDVTSSNAVTATGSGQAQLTAGGSSLAFFQEVLSKTGGTGLLDMNISGFTPIDNLGHFSSTGSLSAIPEPSTFALGSGLTVLGMAVLWRRRRHA